MKIEDIKVGKRKAVIIAGGKPYDFSLEILYKERLEVGEIEGKKFFALKDESDKLLAQQYIFSLLARSVKSKKQAKEKLREKGFFTKSIDYAISKAEEYKLLDDENFAKCYINTYSKVKGSKLLKYELSQKGVEEDIIRRLMDGSEDNEEDSCSKCAEKYKRIKGGKLTSEKLFRHLYSKGFEYETIKKTIESVLRDTE